MVTNDIVINEYMQLLEAVSDAMIIVDRSGGLVFANTIASEHLLKGAAWSETSMLQQLEAANWQDQLQQVTQENTVTLRLETPAIPIQLMVFPSHPKELFVLVVKEKHLSSRELEVLKKEFSEFAYIISHDLQAPVRAVRSLINWFKEDYEEVVDQAGKEQLELLQERIIRLGDMVEGVLEYSRVNRKNTAPATVDLKKVIDKVLDKLQPQDNVQFEIDNQLPTVQVNEQKMVRLFSAILENAFRFANGAVKLVTKETDDTYLIQIKDDGTGIPETKYEEVFKIFKTLAKEEKHIGLGLTIARKIVEYYNGTITLNKNEDQGTVVNISFPKSSIKSSTNPAVTHAQSS